MKVFRFRNDIFIKFFSSSWFMNCTAVLVCSLSYKYISIIMLQETFFYIFSEYNQQDATFHNLFISVRRSTCFRRFFRPSSEAQNRTHSVRYLSDRHCYLLLALARLAAGSSDGLTLYVQFCASDDGRKTRLKHI